MREIKLTRGQSAYVDEEDFVLVAAHSWYAHPVRQKTEKWYAKTTIAGQTVYMHRLIMAAPKGILVDHRDTDGLHNWRTNLRLATRRQNSIHRVYRQTSGFRGVYPADGRYRVRLESDGRIYRLGRFDDPAEAARAYDALAAELHGEFAVLNFPHPRVAEQPGPQFAVRQMLSASVADLAKGGE